MAEYSGSSTRRPGDEFVYAGPERRSSLPKELWLMRMLDEVDHGMLLVTPEGALRYANQLGRRELGHGLAVLLTGGQVQTAQNHQNATLMQALADAGQGRRRLVTLGDTRQALSVAVVPLGDERSPENLALLILGRRQNCETLTIDFFARTQGLTAAEARVLQALCDGLRPKEIARQFNVAISTIRSQISSIRIKTQTTSIRDLVGRVTTLPPITPAMKSVLPH